MKKVFVFYTSSDIFILALGGFFLNILKFLVTVDKIFFIYIRDRNYASPVFQIKSGAFLCGVSVFALGTSASFHSPKIQLKFSKILFIEHQITITNKNKVNTLQ